MKTSFLHIILPLAVLALVTPATSYAGPKGGPGGEASEPTGLTVIPAGTVAETYVISAPGSYILGGDRSMTDGAKHIIEINSPDVTVNLNGFSLSFPGGVSSLGAGVHIAAVENIELRNGSILNGIIGVNAGPGKGMRISDLRVIGGSTGMHSYASDTVVERCQISDTSYMGLSIVGSGSKASDSTVTGSAAFGIFALSRVQLLRVTVVGGTAGVHMDHFSSIRDSHISDVEGIALEVSAYAMIHNNHISNNLGRAVSLGYGNDFSGNFVASTQALGATHGGVYSGNNTNVLTNNRLIHNGTNITGTYVNGGGNTLQ